METVLTAVPLVVFLPLIGMLINLFFGKNLGELGVSVVAVTASGAAFVVSLLLWAGLAANDYQAVVVNPPILDAWIRIPAAGLDIPWQFRVDTLSVTMMLVVSGVGTLIHIYATGYMHGDSRFPRFFVYLNLFLVFMMLLVTGNNLLMMFVGWEGVGLCSYLLIGFWFDKPRQLAEGYSEGWRNSNAARKAFIVNRIGDFGLLMAIFLTFGTFKTLDFYKTGEQPIAVHHAEEAEHDDAAATDEHAEEATDTHAEAPADEHSETAAHEVTAETGQPGIYNQAQLWLDEGGHRVQFGSIDMSLKTVLTLITLLMLLGATGKSAQIPLFIWLPDAMAGPTPVSALIHAATMVTAGVYMMVRSNVFFHAADLTSFIVAVIGCATAIMAGFIALGQWDVKRVLAYSTVSQLGFMVAAVGLGAYGAAMFHLVTHAFFKALLFLGSGSIIHGVEHGHHHAHEHGHEHDDHDHGHDDHEEQPFFDAQDMRNMGGLRHRMPITYWTYLIGTLALAGIFPFAGFWSKDEILADAFRLGWYEGELVGFFALLVLISAAAFTAFYMWRQVCLVFYGEPRTDAAANAPESVPAMTIPLIVLAVLSLLGGFMNIPAKSGLGWLGEEHQFTSWLEHSVVNAHAGDFLWWLALGAVGLAIGAIFAARSIYNNTVLNNLEERDPLEMRPETVEAFRLANAKLMWDETYGRFIEQPFNRASQWLANKLDWEFWHDFVHNNIIYRGFHVSAHGISQNIDRGAIDTGILMGTARSVNAFSKRLRRVQTGFVRVYALAVLFGTVLVVLVLMFPVIRDLLGI